MSRPTIIRFPTSADLRKPMATKLNILQRLWRRIVSPRRRANVAKLRIERARRY